MNTAFISDSPSNKRSEKGETSTSNMGSPKEQNRIHAKSSKETTRLCSK